MSERTYKLLDGSILIDRDTHYGLIEGDRESVVDGPEFFEDVLALVDSLQSRLDQGQLMQQSQKSAIDKLGKALERLDKEGFALREQLAERDRTITRLTGDLEAAELAIASYRAALGRE